VLANITSPVSLAFDGEGRIFYTELGGVVRLYEDGALQPQPVITFTGGFEDPGEGCIDRRLIGIALDPNFTANRYIYISITDAIDCENATNKVIRFQENGGVGVNPTTIFTSTQTGTVHGINNIGFGPDGKLYVSLGDDFNAPNAQDVSVKPGKLHRINTDGTIPADNPVFTQTGALPSLYAMGFRNSFDFTFDTVGGGVRIFMSENGPECDDELNLIMGAHNYGWRPNYPCDDFSPDPTFNTIPPRWYATEAVAPTGVEVYTGSTIGPWQNELFMCNYQDSTLRHFTLSADRTQVTGVATIEGLRCNMDVETGPDGALYYIEDGGYAPGSIKRVRMVEPVACAVMSGQLVPSPNLTGTLVPGTIFDVEVLGANDVWAVGGSAGSSLAVHWDGTRWSNVALPPAYNSWLWAVSGVASNDVWAVGWHNQGSLVRTLTMHWNGVAWSIVPSPNSGTAFSYLYGVHALATNDVWAVGAAQVSGIGYVAQALHWNGTQWSVTPTPQTSSWAFDVEVISSTDAWAVGYTGQTGQMFIMRWNGLQWSEVPGPNVTADNDLYAVDAVSPTEVWAVGNVANPQTNNDTLVIRWDGTQWTRVQSPAGATFYDVHALGSNDIWAVGDSGSSWLRSFHYNGITWNELITPPGQQLRAVEMLSPSVGWAVGTTLVGGVPQPFPLRWDGTQWSAVLGPDLSPQYNTLRSISALSPTDIWAVGTYRLDESYVPLTMRWNGQGWQTYNNPRWGPTNHYLNSVEAVSASDVWAVGYYEDLGQTHTLTEHWNGSQWQLVGSPSPSMSMNHLRGLDASASNNVWAVGYYTDTNTTANTVRPLTLHWNGSFWASVSGPDFGPDSDARLIGVEAFAPDDVWAVGNLQPTPSGMEQTLILHWNGTLWSRVPSPNVNGTLNFLRGVAGAAPDDVWTVGYYGAPGTGRVHLLHWDGAAWSSVPGPVAGTADFLLNVAAISPNNVVAVGNSIQGGVERTLMMRWNGEAWSVVSSPNASAGRNYLFGVTSTGPNDVWGTGFYEGGGEVRTLVERFTPAHFSDVPPDNTFYANIMCLVCKGIISGYADGTFRPNAEVTRGQLSKIVSNSAGFNDNPGPQMFQDVPTGSPFYDWINRLARRGHISGYECGEPGEPCGPGNLPYFRPGANATRGQISKIVANAAGFNEPVSGQTFQDVPLVNPFYGFIERLTVRGVMSGYPCDGPGEPCVPPDNRPYFRWANYATRGQTSKIVANTFFPACQTR
jgi:glucose/arabinose dehydrogenase